jgi:hypothetical protein
LVSAKRIAVNGIHIHGIGGRDGLKGTWEYHTKQEGDSQNKGAHVVPGMVR